MTDTGRTPSSDVDDLIDDILPDDLDEAAIEEAAGDEDVSDGWFRTNYTNSLEVGSDLRDDIAGNIITQIASELHVGDATVSMAENIFSQYVERREKSYLIELQATAALYCACKLNGDAIGPDEISDAGPDLITRKRLLRRSKTIASTLGLDATAFMDASQYVERYCNELDVSQEVRDRANAILELCEEAGLSSGKSPTGWAAAAVYLSGREHGDDITQQTVAEVANTSQVTIRNRYQDQQEFIYGTSDMPQRCYDCIEWLARRASLPEEIQTAAEAIWRCLDGTSYEIQHHDPSELEAALEADPAKWAGALLLLAGEALDESLGTRQFSAILDIGGGELNQRVRISKEVLRTKQITLLSDPREWNCS